jgi:hypothetical protein
MKASNFSRVFWRLGTNPVSQRHAQKWEFLGPMLDMAVHTDWTQFLFCVFWQLIKFLKAAMGI